MGESKFGHHISGSNCYDTHGDHKLNFEFHKLTYSPMVHTCDGPYSFLCNLCATEYSSDQGLARHRTIKHLNITPPKDLSLHSRILHPALNGMPTFFFFLGGPDITTAQKCLEDGTFLEEPPALPAQGDQHDPNWTPFEDCLAFDWAYYHYVTLQLSATSITLGLNLWSATAIKHGSSVGAPWKTTKEMYTTIDAIQTGALPFKTYNFHYTGTKPSTPPHWMEQGFELNARDVLAVVREQLATSAFDGQIDYVPYQEFNSKGERVWSNLMSGSWAFKQAVPPTFA